MNRNQLVAWLAAIIMTSMALSACGLASPPRSVSSEPLPSAKEPTKEAANTEKPTETPEEPADVVQPASYEHEWGVVAVPASEPIMLGFAAGLSGTDLGEFGISEKRGAEMAVEAVGEVFPGFALELLVEDTQCSSKGGATVASKFVADPRIVAVVGHMCCDSSIAASEIYEPAHYTMLSPSCVRPSFTSRGLKTANRVVWNDAIQAAAAAKFARNELSVTRVAMIHDGSPYSESLVNEFASAFKQRGGEIVAQEVVSVGDADLRPVLTVLKTADPELIYFGGLAEVGAALASQREDVGMESVSLMGTFDVVTSEFSEAVRYAPKGIYASNLDRPDYGPGFFDFLSHYNDVHGERPRMFAAQAYDAVMVYANAIRQVGQIDDAGNLVIDRKALNRAVRATSHYQGLSGIITCDEKGDCGTGRVIISEINRYGDWEDLGVPSACGRGAERTTATPVATDYPDDLEAFAIQAIVQSAIDEGADEFVVAQGSPEEQTTEDASGWHVWRYSDQRLLEEDFATLEKALGDDRSEWPSLTIVFKIECASATEAAMDVTTHYDMGISETSRGGNAEKWELEKRLDQWIVIDREPYMFWD